MFPLRRRGLLLPFSLRSIVGQRFKSRILSANEIRRHFIDYFKSTDHNYIRSSPVRPFSDPTLEFVNAGMNQFKNVFLGLRKPPALRATNSQKCIRIGGKHNDLDVVGHDTYHHTFFEMLGNWSFGNYFKKEACEMAWKLITLPPYSLPAEKLYVTYFGGDAKLGLEPDLETRDIWRSIGVSPERILPFGLKENFWEMGLTGPCGPCTEIHYDHAGTALRPHLVNKDQSDLTELWNIVFIQYNREEDGNLTSLQQHFVDTGMGFERLVAILHGKSSNYDSDLFSPLFGEIEKICKIQAYRGKFGAEDELGLDTNYRILADHARMATVAIADNIFPYQSNGLRRVVRKTFRVADSLLPGKSLKLVTALSKAVRSSLESAYPEIGNNGKQVDCVLQDEHQLWMQISSSTKKDWNSLVMKDGNLEKLADVVSPGLIAALKELEKSNFPDGRISDDLALTLYDRYGIDVPLIEELATIKGASVDVRSVEKRIGEMKSANKKALNDSAALLTAQYSIRDSVRLPPTDDSPKYEYVRSENGEYSVPTVTSDVIAFIANGRHLESNERLNNGQEIGLILDRTNCWSSSKGDTDIGRIELSENGQSRGTLTFDCATRIGDHIVHRGIFSCSGAKCPLGNWKAEVCVDLENRKALMRNVTASHLLSDVLRKTYVGHMIFFANSRRGFTIKFVIFDPNVSEAGLILLEHSVNRAIRLDLPLEINKISLNELLGNDEISIPPTINRLGDHFPLVRLQSSVDEKVFREISYGPNLLKTGDIGEFCIADLSFNRKRREVTMKCVTGPLVDAAYNKAEELLDYLRTLGESSSVEELDGAVARAKTQVTDNQVPISYRVELNHLVHNIEKIRKSKNLGAKVKSMNDVVADAKNSGLPFLVHYAGENAKLEKLTRTCQDVPVMLFAYNNGHLTARCCTPQDCSINADDWMGKIAQHLGTEIACYTGHDSKRTCGLKPLKMNKNQLAEVNGELKTIAERALFS
ncbi:tRNA synthetases class II (A) [Nesidiocoris tenuis]|uniref:alanine--tRNA ligase n=2 Tax=Nesidiocoris tenuis TaxID=355587 RepID=A0ABN7B9K7_9HEMI|nr:tRNA synthetases class II (A) [Nesidiocoris tenuis]